MKILLKTFIFIIVTMSNNLIAAQEDIHLTINKVTIEEQNLWYKPERRHPPSSLEEIKELFQTAENVKSAIGGTGSFVTKLKITNENTKNHHWFVNIHANYLDKGVAYWEPDGGTTLALEKFDQLTNATPKMAHSQTFVLPIQKQERGTLWVYIDAKIFPTPAVVSFYDNKAFYETQFFINSLTTFSYTVMITLSLIAFFIFIRTRHLVTLACAGYIGFHGLGWFAASGGIGHLIHPTTFNPVYLGIQLFPFAIASASQFTKLLFSCQVEHKKLAKVFNYLSILGITLGSLMPFIPFEISYLLSHIIAMIWIPLCIGTGIFMLTKKDFRAKYYLVGNLIYAISLSILVLSHIYQFNLLIIVELIVLLALTVDCICISLSLSEWLQIQQKEFNRSYAISRIDPLTQIGNRFAFNESLEQLSDNYCLAFIDLDNFKKINDELGHDVGDKYLTTTANIIQNKIQGLGEVFRCGGDEFILVIQTHSKKDAETKILQVTSLIKSAQQELFNGGWENAGISFGIATSFETLNQSECLSLADQRMYKHKQTRRTNALSNAS